MSEYTIKMASAMLASLLLQSCGNTTTQVTTPVSISQTWVTSDKKVTPSETGSLVTSIPYNKHTLTQSQREDFYKTAGIASLTIPESLWELFLEADWNAMWPKGESFTADTGRSIILGFSKLSWTDTSVWPSIIYSSSDFQSSTESLFLNKTAESARSAVKTGKIMNALLVDGVVWVVTYSFVPSEIAGFVHLQKLVTIPFDNHAIFIKNVFSENYQDDSSDSLRPFYQWGFSKSQREQLQVIDQLISGIKFSQSGAIWLASSTVWVQDGNILKMNPSGKRQYITRHGISYGAWTSDRKYFVFVQKPFIPVVLEGPEKDVVPAWEDIYKIWIINATDSSVKMAFLADKDAEIIPAWLTDSEFSFFHNGSDKITIDLATGMKQ